MRNVGFGLCKYKLFISYSWLISFSYKQNKNIDIRNYKVKVNLSLCMPRRHLGSGGIAPLIPNQDTRWYDWSVSHPGCLHPRNMSPVPRRLFNKYKTVNLERNSKYLWGRCFKIDASVIIDVCCDEFFQGQLFGILCFADRASWYSSG